MAYKAAIFDLDGTILNTIQDLANTLNYALSTYGYPTHTVDEVRRFVGNGVWVLVERGCPKGTPEAQRQKVYDCFVEYYKDHNRDFTRPYEGIPELLEALKAKGVRISVVSNKIEPAVVSLCRDFFPGKFEFTVGNRPDLRTKPAPDEVNVVVEQMDLDRSEIVYIGDTEVDLQTADNSGMDCICVSWGFRSLAELQQLHAKYVVTSPEEILHIVTE